MKIGLYFYPRENLGDILNPLLISQLFPKLKPMGEQGVDAVLLAIGSCLGMKDQHDYMPFVPRIVFGTGYMYESPRPLPDGSIIKCVRGLFTCDRYHLDGRLAIADPGILVPFQYPRTVSATKGTALIHKWNYLIINPTHVYGPNEFDTRVTIETAEAFIEKLWDYENVITDSLHCAMICDAYGIPWKPLRWEPKWMDHFKQVGVAGKPSDFTLSNRELLATRAVQLLRVIDQIKEMMSD